MNSVWLSRQAALVPQERISRLRVLIIGAGGIGSNAANVLISTGVEHITVVDPDVVSDENIYPGLMSIHSLGVPKVTALEQLSSFLFGEVPVVEGFEGTVAEFERELSSFDWDVVLVCTDNIESRREAWRFFGDKASLWLDARMGGTVAMVISFLADDEKAVNQYTTSLLTVENARLACGEKATASLTKGFIPGMIGQSVMDYVNDRKPVFRQEINLHTHVFFNLEI